MITFEELFEKIEDYAIARCTCCSTSSLEEDAKELQNAKIRLLSAMEKIFNPEED